MSRRNEDFDEFCDPENPRILKYDEVVDAAHRVKQYVTTTPCNSSHYQREFMMNVYYKLETVLKTGSFKERGAINTLDLLPMDKKKLGVVVASIGNHAISICYYGLKFGIPVVTVMPTTVTIAKQQRCQSLGAKVIVQGNNLLEAQKIARAIAREKGLVFINGRDHPHALAGYGTVALEVLEQVPNVEAVLVPVGSGGLIAAVATVVKHVKPKCLVYGVQSEKMPVFYKSLENDHPVTIPMETTLADCIAVTNVGVNSFNMARALVDKMLLVNDDWIARSILHLIEKERYVVEGAGACPLAAIIGNLVPELKTKNVVCLVSGGNIDTIVLARCLDRGLAAEGRLVKFRVYIKNTTLAITQIMKLLANGGYNVVRQFQDHIWVENEIYGVEMKFVCETKGLEHALELKRIIEKAYPCAAAFETEPFNDKSICPCYVNKICIK